MENFSQVESNILNKIKKVSDRNSLDLVKTEMKKQLQSYLSVFEKQFHKIFNVLNVLDGLLKKSLKNNRMFSKL